MTPRLLWSADICGLELPLPLRQVLADLVTAPCTVLYVSATLSGWKGVRVTMFQ